MAKHSMKCHPDTTARLVEGLTAEVERQDNGRIWVRYHVDAPVDELELGSPREAGRRDGLWQTTCFEAFVMEAGNPGYLEFNFAPSSEWAAYRFSGYREAMAELPMPIAPELGNDASQSHFALEAVFGLPQEFTGKSLLLAITAVIEELDGTKSCWSLAHPAGAPDFHHPDCFTLHLPARAEP
ncbi:MAG: DOMON-like domain-containing protein [Sphingomonadales bacterium]|nr:DOMON-like domain-containing protein [Sphingomonadales bacterium]MBK9268881.1 DOMON-like domain-containing protein [Sphingomonadales bacterium]MBP6434509.1 DOMON-like domain-containing protein [Sphingorhabdus sp.]